MWAKRGNTNTDEIYSGNHDFARQVILTDDKVRDVMERKWQTVRQQHSQTTRRKYEEWTSRLWSSWVREKKKLATRKISEVRRKAKRMETKVVLSTSDDPTAAEPPSSDLTVPVVTTPLNPRKSTRHQLPPP